MSCFRSSCSEARASAGRVSHDEAGAAFVVQGGVEELNPEIVRVVRPRETKRIAAVFADRIFEAVFVNGVHIERRIGEDEVEVTGAVVLVFIVRVCLADIAFESVDGEVHAGQRYGGANLLLTVDGEFGRWIFLVRLYESRALHEHAAGAGG